jgi:hypothetical protein
MTTHLEDPFSDESSDDDLDDANVEAAMSTDPNRIADLAATFGTGIAVPTNEMLHNSIMSRIDSVRHGANAALIHEPEPTRPSWLDKGVD